MFGIPPFGRTPPFVLDPLDSIRQREPQTKIERTVQNVMKAVDPVSRVVDALTSMEVRQALKTLRAGDHIACNRTCYSHHGIYDGNGRVYEYDASGVRLVTLYSFADGDSIVRVNSKATYSGAEIVRRAASRLGECDYNVVFNNCEHFARWCRNGEDSII